MPQYRRLLSTAVGGLMVAAALAGCGDRITANRDFHSVSSWKVSQQTVAVPGGVATIEQGVLTGPLVDAQNRTLPGTLFREVCNLGSGSAPSGGATAAECTVLVKTGARLYFAAGRAASEFGTFRSKDSRASAGTVTVSQLRQLTGPPNCCVTPGTAATAGGTTVPSSSPPINAVYLVRLSLRTG
jgi:hypothetical protein